VVSGQWSEVSGQKSEVRSQRSVVSGQKFRGQKSEDGSQRTEGSSSVVRRGHGRGQGEWSGSVVRVSGQGESTILLP